MSTKPRKEKSNARKSAEAMKRAATVPLDRNDPRVRALAADLIRETIQKADLQIAAERQQKEQAEKEAAQKSKAAAEAEAKKPLPMQEFVSRMGSLAAPLLAIHDTVSLSLGGMDHEAALIVASNLSMLCLKRLDDCLQRQGACVLGYADDWMEGVER